MNPDGLKQLTLAISIAIVLLMTISIIRNFNTWKFSLLKLKAFSKIKKNLFTYFKTFAIFLVVALFSSLAYSSTDIAQKQSELAAKNFFGDYQHVYLQSTNSQSISAILVNENPMDSNKIKSGIYYNVSFSYKNNNTEFYSPNTSLLAFDDLGIKDNEFVTFGKVSEVDKISVYGNELNVSKDFDINKLNNLNNFRGLLISGLKPETLLVTNISTAKKIASIENNNILFSQNPIDLSKLTNYSNNISEFSYQTYQSQIMAQNNPFTLLTVLSILSFIFLAYPLYKLILGVNKDQEENFMILRSTGTSAGIVTKYLTYFFFLPFIILTILASSVSLGILNVLYNTVDLSFLYSTAFNRPDLIFSKINMLYSFTNIFALFFLIIFLFFYSTYSPSSSVNRFKTAKISIPRLVIGVVAIAFGIISLFFLKDIPEDSKPLIPFIFFSSPLFVLLGSIIFLRLKNNYRRIIIILMMVIFTLGFFILYFSGKINDAPSGLVIVGLLLMFIISTIVNEFSYKDFPKLITASLSTFIVVFITVVSSTGISTTQKYDFDLTIQTYSANDKNIDYENIFPANSVVSKVTNAKFQVLQQNKDNPISGMTDVISVEPKSLSSSNLSDDDKKTFYASRDLIILSPEFSNYENVAENDTFTISDPISGISKNVKVFKIMKDNTNNDLSGKFIYSDLNAVFKAKKSAINNIYILKMQDETARNNLKKTLAQSNVYDIVDVNERLVSSRENSIKIFTSLLYVLIFTLILIIFSTLTFDKIKGLINILLAYSAALLISLYYLHKVTGEQISNQIKILLIIIPVSAIIIYFLNYFVKRKSLN